MPYLAQVIKEESDRLKANKALYEKELQSLPRKGGHIRVRVVKGHEYYYYNFREGEKVKSKYIKKEDVPKFLHLIEKRDKLLWFIEDINKDLLFAEHCLRGVDLNDSGAG